MKIRIYVTNSDLEKFKEYIISVATLPKGVFLEDYTNFDAVGNC